jgi:flagellin
LSSILTNKAALDAARALSAGQDTLAATQARIASGRKVTSPRDNAAVYGIAQDLKADLGAARAVQDSLARGRAILEVAAQGAAQITDLLTEMRGKAAAYADRSLDAPARAALKADMKALVRQIDEVADGSSFGGVNLLRAVTDPAIALPFPAGGPNADLSFSAVADGRPGLIGLALSIYNASPSPAPRATVTGTTVDSATGFLVPPDYDQTRQLLVHFPYGDWTDFYPRDPNTVSIDLHADPFPVPPPPATPPDSAYGVTVLGFAHLPFRREERLISSPAGDTVDLIYRPMSSDFLGVDVVDLASPHTLLARIDAAIVQATKNAGRFGSQQNLVDDLAAQQARLADAVETGIGNLVDADLATESANLQAATVRQQLAGQTLAIANSQPRWLLGLFGKG